MLTRRDLGRIAGICALTEAAFAQRALVQADVPPGAVWLNANENPEGPPEASLKALADTAPGCGRYGFQEFAPFEAALARHEGLEPGQTLAGTGSTEVLNVAVAAFTSAERPLITGEPTFEAPGQIATALARPWIRVPLTFLWAADVKRMQAEAVKAHGGLIYICNPNNPTSSLTPRQDLEWLVSNLPANTVLVIDEAYIHFVGSYPNVSGLGWVREGKPVVVTRTFSKVYGMAGLRIGFACAAPDLIARMRPFRNNAISLAGMRAARAALDAGPPVVSERRARMARTRGELCAWLQANGFKYIEPHANFVMIETGRDVRALGRAMLARGVVVGRPFPPLDTMLRVTIGADAEMQKFRQVFADTLRG